MTTPASAPTPILNPNTKPLVRVGVGVFVLSPSSSSPSSSPNPNPNPSFLMGLRLGSHGANTWGLPGGHMEYGETFEACASREVAEETGLEIPVEGMRYLTVTNNIMEEDEKHYVDVFMVCECEEGAEPRVLEPEKCERWKWMGWEEMLRLIESGEGTEGKSGTRLFQPMADLVKQRPGIIPRLL